MRSRESRQHRGTSPYPPFPGMEASAFRGRKAAAEERAEIKMWRRNVLDVKSLGARGLTRQRRAGCPHGGGHLLGLEDTRQGGKRERSRLELKVCSECGAPRALGRHCRLVKWQRGFCVWQMRGRRAVVIACAGDWHAQLGKGLKEAKGPLVTWRLPPSILPSDAIIRIWSSSCTCL